MSKMGSILEPQTKLYQFLNSCSTFFFFLTEHSRQCLQRLPEFINFEQVGMPCPLFQVVLWVFFQFSFFVFFFPSKKKIEIQLIYNIVLVSGIQHSDSVTYIHIYKYFLMCVCVIYIYICTFQVLFHYRFLRNTEYISLAICRSWLVIYFTYSSVYILIPNS